MTPLWFWELEKCSQGVWVAVYRFPNYWEIQRGEPIKWVRIP